MRKKTSTFPFFFLLTWILGKNKTKTSALFNKWIDSGTLTLTMEHRVTYCRQYLKFPEGSVGATEHGDSQGTPIPSATCSVLWFNDVSVCLIVRNHRLHHQISIKSTPTKLRSIFFLAMPSAHRSSRPGMEPLPQQQSEPLLGQCWIPNPLRH